MPTETNPLSKVFIFTGNPSVEEGSSSSNSRSSFNQTSTSAVQQHIISDASKMEAIPIIPTISPLMNTLSASHDFKMHQRISGFSLGESSTMTQSDCQKHFYLSNGKQQLHELVNERPRLIDVGSRGEVLKISRTSICREAKRIEYSLTDYGTAVLPLLLKSVKKLIKRSDRSQEKISEHLPINGVLSFSPRSLDSIADLKKLSVKKTTDAIEVEDYSLVGMIGNQFPKIGSKRTLPQEDDFTVTESHKKPKTKSAIDVRQTGECSLEGVIDNQLSKIGSKRTSSQAEVVNLDESNEELTQSNSDLPRLKIEKLDEDNEQIKKSQSSKLLENLSQIQQIFKGKPNEELRLLHSSNPKDKFSLSRLKHYWKNNALYWGQVNKINHLFLRVHDPLLTNLLSKEQVFLQGVDHTLSIGIPHFPGETSSVSNQLLSSGFEYVLTENTSVEVFFLIVFFHQKNKYHWGDVVKDRCVRVFFNLLDVHVPKLSDIELDSLSANMTKMISKNTTEVSCNNFHALNRLISMAILFMKDCGFNKKNSYVCLTLYNFNLKIMNFIHGMEDKKKMRLTQLIEKAQNDERMDNLNSRDHLSKEEVSLKSLNRSQKFACQVAFKVNSEKSKIDFHVKNIVETTDQSSKKVNVVLTEKSSLEDFLEIALCTSKYPVRMLNFDGIKKNFQEIYKKFISEIRVDQMLESKFLTELENSGERFKRIGVFDELLRLREGICLLLNFIQSYGLNQIKIPLSAALSMTGSFYFFDAINLKASENEKVLVAKMKQKSEHRYVSGIPFKLTIELPSEKVFSIL